MEKAELPEIPLVLLVVKCELGQVLTGAEITGRISGKEEAAEGCGQELGSWCLGA